jgi:hypothetical protein
LPTPAPIVPAGGNLQVTLKFKPGKAGKDNNELDFTITPTGSIAPCNGKTKVNGSGCNEACADVTMPAAYHVSPTVSKLDTLFLTQGGNDVFVSLPNAANVSDQECIKIHYADTACSSKQITIVPPRTSLFQVVTVPSPLTMLPGSDATVCVQFTAPQIQQVRKDFTLPGEEMKYTDVFSIIDPGCGTTTVPLKAVVDTLPACTDFTLTIYDATTVPQPLPYHQVFNYGNQQVIVSAPAGTIPSSGDLYLTNNSASPNLNITQPSNARGLFKWNNPPFNDVCANKQLVTQALQTLLAGGIAFNTAITGIAPNEIIVVSLGNNAYSVLLVNGVSPGANFNDLITHVAFRVLYPIFN